MDHLLSREKPMWILFSFECSSEHSREYIENRITTQNKTFYKKRKRMKKRDQRRKSRLIHLVEEEKDENE